jgi:DNA repair exonuclease SbcCD ATPase subunit
LLPAIVPVLASELQTRSKAFEQLGNERDQLRAHLEQLGAERRAARDEADRLQAALDDLGRTSDAAQRGHEAAYEALGREFAGACDRWQRQQQADAAEHARERLDAVEQLAAAVRAGAEQVEAVRAELDRNRRTLEDTGQRHETRLASAAQELAAATEQAEERLAALRLQHDEERTALQGEIDRLGGCCATALREHEATAEALAATARERDRRVAAATMLGEQLRALETALGLSQQQTETARDEARVARDEVIALHRTLEQIERREQTALAANGVLQEQIRALEGEAERVRRSAEKERREYDSQRAALLAEAREQQARWESDSENAQVRFSGALDALRVESEEWRTAAELLRQDRDRARGEVEALVENLESQARARATIDAARDQIQAQLEAEIARQSAALAEAECRHEAVVRRSEELAQTIEELRALQDERESECGPAPSCAWVPAVEVTTVKARTDEGWADHHPSERFRAAVTSSAPPDGGGPSGRSDWLPKLRSVTALPCSALGDETSERTFPRDADLALVRAQVEILDQLLRTERSMGHVLIYQQRLTEFALKLREASRLASSLASEVEQTRRRDEMQYHMYLLRRAGEIDKDL